MICNEQKKLIHIYAGAADLSEPTYRNFLREYAAVASASDRRMSQDGFERVMAALETVLFQRVHAGEAANPIGRSRWIRNEYYWRNRLPRDGHINSRQRYAIEKLWERVCEFLPQEYCNTNYLAGIIRLATGKQDVGITAMTAKDAAFLIDALTDRLAHAVRAHSSETQPVAVEEGVPF